MDASRTGAPLRPEGEVQVASAAADFLKLLNNLKRAQRVPTPIEERAAGKGAYEARQREGAQQLLSPEGQQRFSDANNIANEAIRPDPTVRYAEEALNQQPEQVVAGAREGLRGVDPATMETSPRRHCDLQARSRNIHKNARSRQHVIAIARSRLYTSIASTASFFRGLAAK